MPNVELERIMLLLTTTEVASAHIVWLIEALLWLLRPVGTWHSKR